ncbi:MAG TPA: aldose epimerase family protein [Saprospiraceae bacterium]|nr:aldose epimerase family protein [Saprospiraceae bacterium]HMQ82759.1 aldose epimerase family protein [Saprospiraceae bacterium]
MKKSTFKAILSFPAYLFILLLLTHCKQEKSGKAQAESTPTAAFEIKKSDYGKMPDGQAVEQYILKNPQGMEIAVITYGGIITSWTAPDKAGKYENVVLGFDSLSQYVANNPYFGAIIGRYGNRIAKGQFKLGKATFQLENNDGPNHLHGGVKGFDKVVWQAFPQQDSTAVSLVLKYVSADGEGGYPGKLYCTVTYLLDNDNALHVAYEAVTDKETIVNLTQHSYFNLSGNFSNTILDHELMMAADQYLPVDVTLIPTGELAPVAGTPFDFTTAKAIGRDINTTDEQLERGRGYDHCWVLNNPGSMRQVASVTHPATGRRLEISSNEPGLQFYCGNFLDGTLPMPGGGTYGHRTGFCLETQHYPDSPNQYSFPSVLLRPGEKYSSATVFKFLVAE